MSQRVFPKLKNPPINEVICGFIFDAPPGFDILDIGVYWEGRREDFPKKELHPPLFDGGGVFRVGSVSPSPALRAWMVSDSDDLLLQVQSDRFFVNWRARGSEYPRFSNRDGQPGLLPRALTELARFAAFVEQRTGIRPELARIELAKINLLEKGRHYSDATDLGQLMKVARAFEAIQATDPSQLQLRFAETVDHSETLLNIAMGDLGVRIEARQIVRQVEQDLEIMLRLANYRLNEVFFGLFPEEELVRFGLGD